MITIYFRQLSILIIILAISFSSAFAQSGTDDSEMRKSAAARIRREYQVSIDWRTASLGEIKDIEARLVVAKRIRRDHNVTCDWREASLVEMMDVEARLNATKRIKKNYGVTFDWRQTSLVDLLDTEARMDLAKRIATATKQTIRWQDYSLEDLLKMDAKLPRVQMPAREEKAVVPPSSLPRASVRGLRVAVIAPSISTSMEARALMRRSGWIESPLRDADTILVVVRSILFDPLNSSYDSIKELQDDADSQLNIIGENFHIYTYEINDDLSVRQLKHTSYKADD